MMSGRRRRWRHRSSGAPEPMADDLEVLLGQLGAPSVGAVRGVFQDWRSLVGDRVADHTTPRSLRDGELLVDVDDPAWASQLVFLEADLLARFEAALGAQAVRTVRYHVRSERDRPRRI